MKRIIHLPTLLFIISFISLFLLAGAGFTAYGRAPGQDPEIQTSGEMTPFLEYPAATSISTATSTSEFASTPTPDITPSPTPTATSTTVPATSSPITYVPLISKHFLVGPVTSEDYLICDSLESPLEIPDAYPSGIEDKILVNESGLIADIEVYLNVDHTWIGDLQIGLELDGTEHNARLLDRPGVPASDQGCGLDNIRTILDDQASQPAESKCLSYPAAVAGIYLPASQLSAFRGLPASGSWSLKIIDSSSADEGQLNKWCIRFSLSEHLPPPTPVPAPIDLPQSAMISGISGEDQALPLDCESRSAVDWANYFGVHIGEFEFLEGLPISDHPDLGFVGDVNGTWGQIPPADYGVHADPVADLLNTYDLSAQARKAVTWDEVRSEIAANRPVIAWVIGSVINGAPVYYTTQTSPQISIVARYEHTVMVIGYTADRVTILDGDDIYTRSLDRFLESWSALNNMAIRLELP